jgi:hypothetical protein
MGPGARAVRDAAAQERLLAAADVLAGRFDLAAQHEALVAARTGPAARDPLLAALFQREAIADLLDALLAATEPIAEVPAPDERLADLTAAEVGVRIDTMDAATLDRLAALEAAGQQRKTVLAAIDKRRKQLATAAEAGA